MDTDNLICCKGRLYVFFTFQGNVKFVTSEDVTETTTPKEVELVAKLLKVTPEDLREALTARVIAARGEVMQKTHTSQQAETGRDALAKVRTSLTQYAQRTRDKSDVTAFFVIDVGLYVASFS